MHARGRFATLHRPRAPGLDQECREPALLIDRISKLAQVFGVARRRVTAREERLAGVHLAPRDLLAKGRGAKVARHLEKSFHAGDVTISMPAPPCPTARTS